MCILLHVIVQELLIKIQFSAGLPSLEVQISYRNTPICHKDNQLNRTKATHFPQYLFYVPLCYALPVTNIHADIGSHEL
jgi:hypothetical protein